tara:strand:+ start:218 stop:358 length:141 start_codon:yes stop_codon:yes gene_type:complete
MNNVIAGLGDVGSRLAVGFGRKRTVMGFDLNGAKVAADTTVTYWSL